LQPGKHLSTVAVDFIIQHAMQPVIRQLLIFGSSNAMPFFVENNKKTLVASSTNSSNSRSIQRLRDKYRHYSSSRFQFLAAICIQPHFFAVDVTFDIRKESIFDKVVVYDSLNPISSNNINIPKNSNAGQFLLQLQLFLSRFCFCDLDHNDKLLIDSEFILQKAVYAKCPQQENQNDCSIFALAIILHLARGLPIVDFTTVPVPTLNPDFISSFFPQLSIASRLPSSPARDLTNNRSLRHASACPSVIGLVEQEVAVTNDGDIATPVCLPICQSRPTTCFKSPEMVVGYMVWTLYSQK
jgi:hypothetical protein